MKTKDKSSKSSSIMEGLLASLEGKSLSYNRGQYVNGKVISISDSEVVLDLGVKAEGLLPKNELGDKKNEVKVGQQLSAYVVMPENESGQVILSLNPKSNQAGKGSKRWGKFQQAMTSGQVLTGRVGEINKGGLVVEIDSARGFLPSSQIRLSSFGQVKDLSDLVDKTIQVNVIEIDERNNRLIFSQKAEISDQLKQELAKFKIGDTIEAEVMLVMPNFGLFVKVGGRDQIGAEGLVHIQDIAWERVEDLSKLYKIGDKVQAKILSVDESLGRLNLSIKAGLDDPFAKLSEKYQPDDVVKATMLRADDKGVWFKLDPLTDSTSTSAVSSVPNGSLQAGSGQGLEALMPIEKVVETYQPGSEVSLLIGAVDPQKRQILVTPMLTSTSGLIYK
ncbi:S1 RNA-binding domain-containing protein [Candidatus Daviesbacteria bacterium]|nr:S1 RNA-binding domain-containing protein [Candidatus Daviesbacteria bacterium]